MKLTYLISGRSASSWGVGRKILEVTDSFKKLIPTELVCGGDIKGGIGYKNVNHTVQSVAEYHKKWYRQNEVLNFFVRSLSELKDLYHCYETYLYLKKITSQETIIWERSSRLHFAGIYLAKKRNLPCVLEWKDHLVDYKFSLLHSFALYIEKWKNKTADYIAVESEVLKSQLINEGVDGRKIYVAYNAVNPDEFKKDEKAYREIREEFGIKENDLLVGYVGSYAFYHDSIRMVKAAKILKDDGNQNIKWLLIGDGKDKFECEKYARDNALLGENVFMLPFQSKELIPRYLSAMDVAILPGSTDIICPIKVMEYMAAKSVVLVPDYECNREIINGHNGLLFKPKDENSIVEALLSLNNNHKRCRELGDAARRTVVERLTWDKTYGIVLRCILENIVKKV